MEAKLQVALLLLLPFGPAVLVLLMLYLVGS
jgi:hypothetical protein